MLQKDYRFIRDQITRTNDTSYIKDIHYLTITDVVSTAVPEIYLTFHGVLKTFYSSRTGVMNKYIDCVTKLVYTTQMGTPEQRVEVSQAILKNGASAKSIIQLLDCRDSRTDKKTGKYKDGSIGVTGLYLISPGTVGQHRKTMAISMSVPDNHLVMKYGLSKDISQRLASYPNKDFKELNVTSDTIEVITTRYVDKEFLEDAEGSIANFVDEQNWGLEYKEHVELFTIDPKHLKMIKEKFHDVARRYSNDASQELNKRIEVMTIEHLCKIKDLTNDFTIKEIHYQNELKLKDKELELKDKDIEVERLKNEVLMMKLGRY